MMHKVKFVPNILGPLLWFVRKVRKPNESKEVAATTSSMKSVPGTNKQCRRAYYPPESRWRMISVAVRRFIFLATISPSDTPLAPPDLMLTVCPRRFVDMMRRTNTVPDERVHGKYKIADNARTEGGGGKRWQQSVLRRNREIK